MFLVHDKEERVLVRKGFIREALRNGMDVVPVYHFNHTRIFRYLVPESINKHISWLCRKSGLPFGLYYGRFGSPYIPFKTKLTSVVGRAIRVEEAIPNPSPELVDAYVAEYKREMTRLYYTYRPEGCEKELVLLDKYPF